ncbi:hypothetical protein KTE69_01660 [Burkholderia multivorans]|nr:hypothetical protein [Burkholderia multivorans]
MTDALLNVRSFTSTAAGRRARIGDPSIFFSRNRPAQPVSRPVRRRRGAPSIAGFNSKKIADGPSFNAR